MGLLLFLSPDFALAQLAKRNIPAVIPRITTHASPIPAYGIALAAALGVTIMAFRNAHRGTRGGGREK